MVGSRVIAGCLTCIMVTSWMTTATADTISGGAQGNVQTAEVTGLSTVSQNELAEIEQWTRLSPFISVIENGFVVDLESARKSGLSADFLDRASATYATLNMRLTSSGFAWDQFAANRQNRIDAGTSGDVRLQASTQCDLLGCRVAFNEWETQIIINALWTGAGAAGVYAALAAIPGITLPAAVVVGLVAAILAFGGGYLGLVDTLGHNRGIYFGIRWIPWSVVVWHN